MGAERFIVTLRLKLWQLQVTLQHYNITALLHYPEKPAVVSRPKPAESLFLRHPYFHLQMVSSIEFTLLTFYTFYMYNHKVHIQL
jgi:hypothetical protein